jgi:hypothetical protein
MLELIGLIALIYLAVKFLPGILVFALKVLIVLIGIWLVLNVLVWIFGWPNFLIVMPL